MNQKIRKKRYLSYNKYRGSIMVVCIWLLISLSFLALSVGRLAYSQIKFSRFYHGREFSYYLAKAAVREAVAGRANDLTLGYDTLYELRTVRPIDFEGIRGEYYLIDEGSKINVNTANKEILAGILNSEDLAQQIIDYRQDERLFIAIEEIMGLEIEEENFSRIKDFITVNSNGYVNVNTAAGEVFLALGCNSTSVEKILDYREDNIFDSQAAISSVFNDLGIECGYTNLLKAVSSAYTIKTSAYIGERAVGSFDIIYVSADNSIKSWKTP
ncbi:MAG: hypothetical protein ABH914_01555 [Candidatus Omnitrophota bacterium]